MHGEQKIRKKIIIGAANAPYFPSRYGERAPLQPSAQGAA
jgi:hypothetical protein